MLRAPSNLALPFALVDSTFNERESRVSSATAARIAIGDSKLPQPLDEAAFQELHQRTAKMLWSYIRRASGDAAVADDILQETFYRFLRARLPRMEPNQSKAYLYRIANSLLSDHWRRARRERRWSLANFLGWEPAQPAPQPSGDAMTVFARLRPREQGLLWLAYVEGSDHREIAAALEIEEKSVRVLLFRARQKLAELLARQGIGPEEKP